MAATDILTTWREVMCDAVRADGPDLSMRQWSILLTVYMSALDALSILGFVKRVRDPNDKRIVLVQKTTDGAIYLDGFARLVESHAEEQPLGALYG